VGMPDGEMTATFFRVLESDKKGEDLEQLAHAVREERRDPRLYRVSCQSFTIVPRSPFCYWVSERVRLLFTRFGALEGEAVHVRVGDHPGDGFRYLRLSHEVVTHVGRDWRPYQKGGAYSPYYYDIHLVADWDAKRESYRGFFGRAGRASERPSNYEYFFRPGLTWPRRTQRGLAFRTLPRGCVFADKGPGIFVVGDGSGDLLRLLGIVNSAPFRALVELQMAFGSFEVGVIQRTPVPVQGGDSSSAISQFSAKACSLRRSLDEAVEVSHAFALPALLLSKGATLMARAKAWEERVANTERELAQIQTRLDSLAFELYGIEGEDRALMEAGPAGLVDASESVATQDEEEGEEEDDVEQADATALAAALVSWLVGVAFGRFDVRLATGDVKPPAEPDPFEALPASSPGMLVGPEGHPARAEAIASVEWCNARPDANRLPEPRSVKHSTVTAKEYPLSVAWAGVLVDDPGIEGPADLDVVKRVRQVLDVLWGEQAGDIEAELCELLDVQTLRDYLRKPSGFFEDDLRRYSKSRRKAPIYWPLSTVSGAYTVWVYHARLSDDTLYRIVSDHVSPKLTQVAQRLAQMESELGKHKGRDAARVNKELAELTELRGELEVFKEHLLRIADLPYRPDLNDGVQITAAPLWSLFRHKPWQTLLRRTWQDLESGKYDWAHLAYAIWPERVKEKCKTDKSLAIAHAHEEPYKGDFVEAKPKKARRSRR
jgi:hypothetical protein